jgi:hypothetical protein
VGVHSGKKNIAVLIDEVVTQFVREGKSRARRATWRFAFGVAVDVKLTVLALQHSIEGVAIVPIAERDPVHFEDLLGVNDSG